MSASLPLSEPQPEWFLQLPPSVVVQSRSSSNSTEPKTPSFVWSPGKLRHNFCFITTMVCRVKTTEAFSYGCLAGFSRPLNHRSGERRHMPHNCGAGQTVFGPPSRSDRNFGAISVAVNGQRVQVLPSALRRVCASDFPWGASVFGISATPPIVLLLL